jgi:beta-1,4-N-acetylglucosaminyltransferase
MGPSGGSKGRQVFVTVGTTKFDALISAVDDPQVAEVLVSKGYSRLVMQIGAGAYRPHRLLPGGTTAGRLPCGLEVEYFEFAPSLKDHMEAASLIISHAGSGSLFEGLRMGKVILAVPNEALMDNHQAELAGHLSSMGVLFSAVPAKLVPALQKMDPSTLVPFEAGNPRDLAAAINKLMGFK